MARNRSVIWDIPDVEIQAIIDDSDTMSEVCTRLGLSAGNGSIRTLYRRLTTGFDYSKLRVNRSAYKSRTNNTKLQHTDVFKVDSNIPRKTVRKILLRDNLIPYLCYKCDQVPFWRGEPLSLQVEHRNGINTDHRLENLCFLCPNCHTQTPTYGSKNRKGR